jgi:hypothetical protein
MQEIDAIATLASFRYSPDTAGAMLRDARAAGSAVRMGVRVTWDARRGYRVARADRSAASTRTRRGAQRARNGRR